ncbi:GNAT family N-acetyltransferase [Amycolatopsis sp. SID8362]|uniref:GNAT family N-acetyltransferase n=1 Tax=Amycolatopsis sp. SID8362 TaxID=2690346 RepID=UPI00136F7B8E|nr:GNAT family N-acetyltransferase [Amycolatopsis sp. SID8362]NBH06412.1 GNAT family N-acetyltransferase [Amycolatopsis sp. SID8362]NED43110.1 GNAT family N-acetyltransferase [Amycolatopsis sp. SID8362]
MPESVWVAQSDPRVRPLLADLAREYSTRYHRALDDVHLELREYPARRFAAPEGGLLLLVRNGHAVAGGAFQRHDDETAELKRIWTHRAHRGTGLARRVVAELEFEAARRGYSRIFLTTGPNQPEARGLYLATGYTPHFDVDAVPATRLPFSKALTVPVGAR